MNKNLTLIAAFPLFLILTILIVAVLFLPNTTFDIRNRAADPNIFNPSVPQITSIPQIPQDNTPLPLTTNIGCSSLYQPVCGTDNITYENACEASSSGAQVAYRTPCVTLQASPTSIPLPLTY